jgi:hypothetical protein
MQGITREARGVANLWRRVRVTAMKFYNFLFTMTVSFHVNRKTKALLPHVNDKPVTTSL